MRFPVLALAALTLATPVAAQVSAVNERKPGLPIAEGLWVETSQKCSTAKNFWVYHGFTFGSTQSEGPRGIEFEQIETLVRTSDGYIRINGELEIKANANGTATLRAVSLAEGEIWRETLRRCNENELSQWMRDTAQSIRTVPNAPAVFVPEKAKGSWSIGGTGADRLALYSGDGLIESVALGCADAKSITIGVKLRRAAPIDATRLNIVYEEGNVASGTAIYRVSDTNQWVGAAGEGIVDTLDTQSTIILDMGPVGSEQISLTGSRAAIRPALAACWTSQRGPGE